MMSLLAPHRDLLAVLNESAPLAQKLETLQGVICKQFPYVDNIVVSVYEPDQQRVKTFAQSQAGDAPSLHYETELGSLESVLEDGRPRVVRDLEEFASDGHADSKRVFDQGYRASYTMPMYLNGALFGFLFLNSRSQDVFAEEDLGMLDVFGHLISLTVINELSSIRTLLATIQAARDMTHHRDVETGAHVSRTAHYARLIASELAPVHGFTDDYVEHVFLFSPLHDIGKLAVPDAVLRKPGRLDADEFEVMKGHAKRGRDIIDAVLDDFGLAGVEHIDVLRNIAYFHHEAMDGSGYPEGLTGEAIPIEARIMAVADIFDALTSRRPYKDAWDNDRAFELLRRLSGRKLDAACVDALLGSRARVEQIQHQFAEDMYG